MNPPWLAARIDDPPALERLSAAIREWDPAFDLYRPSPDALLYEPDGTLYAVALQTPMTAEVNRRERVVRPGDLLIVPRGLAVGIEPSVDLLGIRFDGEPPDHFRERFIQVWGFDHLPADDARETIAAADARFPLSYAVRRLVESSESGWEPEAPPHARRLLVVLEGRITIETGGEDRAAIALAPRDVLLVTAQQELSVRGPGRWGVVRIEPEIVFSARRAADRRAGTGTTPEYLPPPSQSSGP